MAADTSIYGGLDTQAPMRIAQILSPANIEKKRIENLIQQEQAVQAQESGRFREFLKSAGTSDPAQLSKLATAQGFHPQARQFQQDALNQQKFALQEQDAQRKAADDAEKAKREGIRTLFANVTDAGLISGGFDPAKLASLPPETDSVGRRQALAAMTGDESLIKMMTPTWQTVGAKRYLVDPFTGQTTRSENVEAQLPAEYERTAEGRVVMRPEIAKAKQGIAAAGKAGPVTVSLEGDKGFKNEMDLRKEFAGLPIQKAFTEVQSAYDQIKAGLARPSPASDLAAATKLMKLLDPGSVVRESELGMAMAATGLEDRARSYLDRLRTGEKLTPDQRKDFAKLADDLYSAAASRYDPVVSDYRGIASQWGFKPDRVAKTRQEMSPNSPKQAAQPASFKSKSGIVITEVR